MANVLKKVTQPERDAAQREVTGLAGFNLNDLANEGRSRLEECRKQVREMLAEAEQQAQAIRVEAQRLGYEEGLAQAGLDIRVTAAGLAFTHVAAVVGGNQLAHIQLEVVVAVPPRIDGDVADVDRAIVVAVALDAQRAVTGVSTVIDDAIVIRGLIALV